MASKTKFIAHLKQMYFKMTKNLSQSKNAKMTSNPQIRKLSISQNDTNPS